MIKKIKIDSIVLNIFYSLLNYTILYHYVGVNMLRILYILFLTIPLFANTLNELIEYATIQSTIAKQTDTQIELTKLKHDESKANQYGSLDLSVDATHFNIARTLIPLTPTIIGSGAYITTVENLFSTGIVYTVPLFTGFAQTRQIEIEEIGKNMSLAKARLTKEQLVYNIRSLYLSILAQQEILKAQKTYTEALQKLTKQISYEVEIGKKAKIDFFKAESDSQASYTQQEILESSIEMTKASLSALVGKKVSKLTPLNIEVIQPHYLVDTLYANASSLRKVEMEDMDLRKADKMIAKIESAKLPQVKLNSYLGKNYGVDVGKNEWDDETLWQVGVNVKWNILDFGKRDLEVQQAKIAKMQANFKKEQTLLDLHKLLTQGIEKIKQSYTQYVGNTIQLRLSEQSEKIEKVRYENAVATLNDLLLAQGKKQIVKAKLIESKYNYQKSIYYLDYLLEQGVK